MEILSGLAIGALGSLHCLGMCGPIALAIPHREGGRLTLFSDTAAYNFGRVLTYTFMGILVGALGASISIAGYQRWISVLVGATLLIMVVFPGGFRRLLSGSAASSRFFLRFKDLFHRYLTARTIPALFALGFLNGLLPCGLVYVALATALAAGGVVQSALLMAAFGLGTVPMMASVYLAKRLVPDVLRRRVNTVIRVGVASVGVLLILRGMSLGIPYVSPVLTDDVSAPAMHHH